MRCARVLFLLVLAVTLACDGDAAGPRRALGTLNMMYVTKDPRWVSLGARLCSRAMPWRAACCARAHLRLLGAVGAVLA